ncbi:MAG: DNA polymerase IV, partial [Oscillospiraceae bacterium]
MAERVILHCDCNSFYASVELLRHPELRDVPVAVSGSVDDRHGIILAKNEAAKKYGVQTAETVWQAKRKCPQLVFLPPHHSEYRRYSKIINGHYGDFTDRVEPFGIDESWLDLSGSWQLFGTSPLEVADKIRRTIKEKTGLTISIGLSFNKVFAKLGSDYKKPDAITEITRENYQEIIWPLPVSAMLYVGQKSRKTLEALGIGTIGALAAADEGMLRQVMGKQGPLLLRYARGEDTDPVLTQDEQESIKSVGNGLTFKRNLLGYRDVRVAVGALADEVAGRLRRHKLYASNLQVLIKNPDLKSISRQRVLPHATNLARELTETAMEILKDNWDFAKPIRMLTLTAQQLSDLPFATQTSLFEEVSGMDP